MILLFQSEVYNFIYNEHLKEIDKAVLSRMKFTVVISSNLVEVKCLTSNL